MPCFYVAGNLEFYKGSIREGLEEGRRAAQEFPGVHFLDNDTVTIGGILFIGATLWTDYRIEGHQLLAMRHARGRMNDYRQIVLQRKPWQRFSCRKPRRGCTRLRDGSSKTLWGPHAFPRWLSRTICRTRRHCPSASGDLLNARLVRIHEDHPVRPSDAFGTLAHP